MFKNEISSLKVMIFTILLLPAFCNAANILTIIPFPMKSHDIVYKPLILELARRGHNVTSIGPYQTNQNLIDDQIRQNYREIIYESKFKDIFQRLDLYELRNNTTLFNLGWWDLFLFWDITYNISEDIYNNPAVKRIINYSKEEKFDLIIGEGFFGFESIFAFGKLFESPVIHTATFGTHLYIDEHTGNPLCTSSYPNFLLPYSDRMNFIQRLHNLLFSTYVIINTYLFHLPNQNELIRKYFSNAVKPREMPPITDMLTEVSLVFLNTHIPLSIPRPYVPNVIEIGGLHIQTQRNNTVDQDLKNLMNNAKHGVVYFSLGSNVNVTKMPEKYAKAFVDFFSKIPQLILWKSENRSLPGLTKNVHKSGWFPQQQILAHKNCIAFITHGGILSLQEAIYHEVPVIGIPFFGDQFMNMKRVEELNYGINLDYNNITYESLSWSLNEIISNQMYQKTVKRLSSIFRDRNDGSPLDRAVYWVEYILKYDGASHLKSTARLLPRYKYLSLDVILVLISFILIFAYIIFKSLKLFLNIANSMCHKNKKNKSD